MILQMFIYIIKYCYVLVFWLFRMFLKIIVQLIFFFLNLPCHPLWKIFAIEI